MQKRTEPGRTVNVQKMVGGPRDLTPAHLRASVANHILRDYFRQRVWQIEAQKEREQLAATVGVMSRG